MGTFPIEWALFQQNGHFANTNGAYLVFVDAPQGMLQSSVVVWLHLGPEEDLVCLMMLTMT
jgi:hypothetical protein